MKTYQEKRERLRNRPTRYELIAQKGDRRVLIAYCMRTGRHSILEAARKHGQALIDLMEMDDNATLEWLQPARLGAKIGDWSIRFSGRTQREAIGSELPWIGDTSTLAA